MAPSCFSQNPVNVEASCIPTGRIRRMPLDDNPAPGLAGLKVRTFPRSAIFESPPAR